ncbi:SDR family NAD(P)-dependent oxidoreductase [Rhodanobacter aciditrophus]|uniref:SDR family NAD(P)-dependent oxidoreductase n=1 Tax=Rhodanobacter aciditrophus TaxID=1623218 RepID=A0ABW4AWJ2_9GAMM
MNKLALITGGSRGIGQHSAQALAQEGVDIIITYHSQADAASDVVNRLKALGVNAAALSLDTSKTDTFPNFVARLKHELNTTFNRASIDYLFNNAGTGLHSMITDSTEADFDEMYQLHLKGPFFLTQALYPMINEGGSILNISSGLARFSLPGSASYAIMKGGVEVMSRYMAKEFSDRSITVNTLAPGAIATDFRGGAVRDNPEMNKMVASFTALGRVGLPEDIGRVVAQLLNEKSHWMTGQRIEASGGMFL